MTTIILAKVCVLCLIFGQSLAFATATPCMDMCRDSMVQSQKPAGERKIIFRQQWPDLDVTVVYKGEGHSKELEARLSSGETIQGVVLSMATSVPSQILRLGRERLLVRADGGVNSRVSQLMVVDLSSRKEVENLYVGLPAVSPDYRFIAYERVPLSHERVGSTVLLYDLMRSSAANRLPSAESFVDVGLPLYPEYLRSSQRYVPESPEDVVKSRLLSEFLWASPNRLAFVSASMNQVAVILLMLDGDGHVVRTIERSLDMTVYIEPVNNVPAADLVRIEALRLVSQDESGVRVRMRIGPGADVTARWIDVELR